MAEEIKKSRPKYGGRKAGTPNKVTSLTKAAITQLLTKYKDSGLMDADFEALEPKDRMMIAEKLMQYTMPKIQSVEVDLNDNTRRRTIEDKLLELVEEEKK